MNYTTGYNSSNGSRDKNTIVSIQQANNWKNIFLPPWYDLKGMASEPADKMIMKWVD